MARHHAFATMPSSSSTSTPTSPKRRHRKVLAIVILERIDQIIVTTCLGAAAGANIPDFGLFLRESIL
jgi:hypothetical protein